MSAHTFAHRLGSQWSTAIDILLTIFAAGISEATATLLKDFTVAMVIAAAGLALARVAWQPPVLGYLVAGMLIGPYTLPTPLITNLDTIGLLAELGLILLLFGIGLELGWRRIRNIGFRVLIIGVIEISVLTMLGVWIASILPGIDPSHGLFLGGAIAISSSAILLKGLRDAGNLNSTWGQTIVGILLVEDFAAVILLTVLAGLATTGTASLADAGLLAGKLAIFCVVVLVMGTMLGSRVMRWLSQLRSDETLLVASLGFCFLLALCATLLGLSPAAGAFLIGVVIGDTAAAERVTRMVSPVRDMFGALFFLSIGMLIDYRTLDDYLLPGLVVVGVFMVGKMVANTIGSILAGRNADDAARVGMTMPQMGEFSLAIGRLSPSDVAGGSALGPVLSIATAITSVLAPLTSRSAAPMCEWIGGRAPGALRRFMLAIQLAVDFFWSAFTLRGAAGDQFGRAGRIILINACIIGVLSAVGAGLMYSAPDIVGKWLPISSSLSGLIIAGMVIGLSVPPAIGIWRSLKALGHLAADEANVLSRGRTQIPGGRTVQEIVINGLGIALLAALLLLNLPMIIRLFVLGALPLALSLLLLLSPALALGIISFRVHRVLEPAFTGTFTGEPDGSMPHDSEEFGSQDAESPVDAESPAPEAVERNADTQRTRTNPLIAAELERMARRDAGRPDTRRDSSEHLRFHE